MLPPERIKPARVLLPFKSETEDKDGKRVNLNSSLRV